MTKTMQALVFYRPGEMRVEEVPVPEIGPDEILVRVHACSICGTDLRTFKAGHTRIKGRRVLGHEFSGVVARVGAAVEGFAEGDRVMVVPGISCGMCAYCRQGLENLCLHRTIIGFDYDGAFAEYVRIPAAAIRLGNVRKLPDPFDLTAAALVEPFTAVYNGQRLLNIRPGETVGIIGAGPIGVMHLLQARAQGAALVGFIEISEGRIQEARRFRPDFVINSRQEDPVERVRQLTGLGLDVVIVAAGSAEAQRLALEIARPAGRVSFFAGLPHDRPEAVLNTNLLHYKQLAVFGANGSGPNQYDTTLRWLASGAIDLRPLITTELPLAEVHAGFDRVARGEGLKVVIRP
ncbi:MAG: zinc-dependent dehydrogenase [Firmicutes bacterium]|nr:zinc-dependent dehydrogenase [Bacillota bacterium]